MAHLGSGSPIRQHHHHSHQEFFQQPCLTLSDKPKLRAQICPAAVSSQLPSLKALPPLPHGGQIPRSQGLFLHLFFMYHLTARWCKSTEANAFPWLFGS